MDYNSYIRSVIWKQKKDEKLSGLKLEHVRCKICHNPENLTVHHKTYKRLGNEKLSDLILLCQECHRELHKRVRNKEGGLSSVIGKMKRIKRGL